MLCLIRCHLTSLVHSAPHQHGWCLAKTIAGLQVHYLESPASSYVKAAVQTVQDIHREGLPGDILVFLTGKHLQCRC